MAQRFDVKAVTGAVAAALAEGERATRIVAKLETGQLRSRKGERIRAMSNRQAWRYIGKARERLTAPEDGQQLRPGEFLRMLAEKAEDEPESPDVSPVPASVPETPPNAAAPDSPPEPPSPRELLIRRVVAAVAAGRDGGYGDELDAYLRSAGNGEGLIRRLEKLEAQHRDSDCLGVIREALRELRPPQPVRRVQRDRYRPLPRRSPHENRYSWEAMTGTRRFPRQ